jgi:ssDNA-binding Zn-finger/Zn-ribbon topoisomerase 1
MARTQGSGWGAGSPTFQICPSCGRKTLYFYGRLFVGSNGFRCKYARRGCEFSEISNIDAAYIRSREFTEAEKKAHEIAIIGS